MEKVKEIATGKAKSMFTTSNPDYLLMDKDQQLKRKWKKLYQNFDLNLC